jgi:hypothetical protein
LHAAAPLDLAHVRGGIPEAHTIGKRFATATRLLGADSLGLLPGESARFGEESRRPSRTGSARDRTWATAAARSIRVAPSLCGGRRRCRYARRRCQSSRWRLSTTKWMAPQARWGQDPRVGGGQVVVGAESLGLGEAGADDRACANAAVGSSKRAMVAKTGGLGGEHCNHHGVVAVPLTS